MSIKVKRGLAINLPTLEEGELGFTTDSYEMYVGSDNGNILLNNGEILIRRNNGMLQYAQSSRKNQWFDICSLEEIRGDQGVQGIQGIQGVKGDKGDKGERGIQGEKGNPFTYADFTPDQLRALKGEKGDTGAKGERGLTGDKGDRGVGLNYAWSGTRLGVKRDTDAQYTYVDLRGADGKDGKQGERGERGIQGEKGDTPSIAHLEQQVSDKTNELDKKFNTLTAKQQQDAEVVTARDGEVSLHARLERDLEKGKIHFVDVEGSNISTESEEGYLENVEIHGNTWQDSENLSDIRSVGTKVEGQELYEIPVLSCGKNLWKPNAHNDLSKWITGTYSNKWIKLKPNTTYSTLSVLKKIPTNHCVLNIASGEYAGTDNNKLVLAIVFNHKNGDSSLGSIRNFKFTTPSDGMVCLQYYENGHTIAKGDINLTEWFDEICDIHLEETNTHINKVEPYKEDKLTILSPTPLEKVGDIADKIVCKDGVWGVDKNISTVLLNGSEGWNYEAISTSYYTNVSTIGKSTRCVISDKYTYVDGFPNIGQINLGGAVNNKNGNILINHDGGNMGVANFKQYLKNVNVIVKYPTTQPTFIPLPHDQQVKLRTFADRTNISFLTEIEPTLKAQVPKSLGATVNTHTSQIDNLNKELDRVKKLEESTVSTVETERDFTTVEATSNGYFEDVKLEGKTLVNLANIKTIESTGRIKYLPLKMDFAIGRTYTIVFNLNKDIDDIMYFAMGSWSGVGAVGISSPRKGTHIVKVVGVLDESVNGFKRQIGVWCNKTNGGVHDYILTDIIVLEGDHTDKDITFFEGLKSVGQDSDEISVSSVNNDYFNYYLGKEPTKTYFRLNEYITTGAVIKNISQNPIKCLAYKNGVWDKDVYLRKNEVYVVETEYDVRSITIATGDNWNISKDYFLSDIVEISVYKQDKKQVLYYNSTTQTWEKPILREWDSIEKHSDGKYYYHKRSGEVVLNGSESWYYSNSLDSTKPNYFIHHDPSLISKSMNVGFCNNFIIENPYSFYENCVGIAPNGSARIRHNDYNNDLDGFKTWLQANPTTVVYQLAKEEVYECTSLDLITYSGETNLIANSGTIQPRLKLKVLSNVSNVVKLLQEKVSILENKFIKGLQQVLAGDMMSLAHLLYPEDFALENGAPQVIPYIEEGDINE